MDDGWVAKYRERWLSRWMIAGWPSIEKGGSVDG
jgi:hypothetical protein